MGWAETTLGQRIVAAARMALVLHLAQDGFEQDGQQEAGGGAAIASSTDGALPPSAEGEAA